MPPPRRVARTSPASAKPTVTRSAVPPSVSKGMSPPITSVTEGRSNRLAVAVYAEPGDGKTTLVGTCADIPGVKKVLILRPPVDHTDSITNPNVEEWVMRTWSDMDDAMVYLRNEGGDPYDWVWLDSGTLWQSQGLDDIWNQVLARKPGRADFGLDKGEYGKNMVELERWIRAMVGSDQFHFGCTWHVAKRESTGDEDNPSEKLMPLVQGKNMPAKITAMMNVVCYLHKEDIRGRRVRVLECMETDKFYAKVGFPGWETQRLVSPTMPKLVEALQATGTNAADAVEHKSTSKKAGSKKPAAIKTAAAIKRPARRTK